MSEGNVVKTRQFDPGIDYDEACDVIRWCGGKAVERGMELTTRLGVVTALPGDPIVQYANGTFDIQKDALGEYPCSSCGATDCLDAINRGEPHCCMACAFGAHERTAIPL